MNNILLLLIIISHWCYCVDEMPVKYFIKFNVLTEEKDVTVNEEIVDQAVLNFIPRIIKYKKYDPAAGINSGKGATLLPLIETTHYICDAQGKTVYSISDNFKIILSESVTLKYYIFEQNDRAKIQKLIARIERIIKNPSKPQK